MTQWMTWAEFMRQCHEGPGLPREVLGDLEYARVAREHGVEPEEFLKMVEGERAKGYSRTEAYTRAIAKLKTGRQ
jgi:hypothetical protein